MELTKIMILEGKGRFESFGMFLNFFKVKNFFKFFLLKYGKIDG
jgi:hypothetical protein